MPSLRQLNYYYIDLITIWKKSGGDFKNKS